MSEMIERVARALYERDRGATPLFEGAAHFYRWDGPIFKGQDYFRRLARAAIEVMREPTDEMARHAADECSTTDLASPKDFRDHYAGVWESMILGALGKVDA